VGSVTIAICPACGYPTLGPDLCAFCRPLASVGARQALPAPPTTKARAGFSPERAIAEPDKAGIAPTRGLPPPTTDRVRPGPGVRAGV
jgi:hypothetical protein